MKKVLIAIVLLSAAVPAGAEMIAPASDITAGAPSDDLSLFINPRRHRQLFMDHVTEGPSLVPTGDTYDVSPLVQSATAPYFLSDLDVKNATFDGTSEAAGGNLMNPGSAFSVIETFQPGAGPNGGDLIQVEMASRDSNGFLSPWIGAGMTAPDGSTLIGWRMDVGAASVADGVGVDAIDPGYPFVVIDATMSAFNLSGTSFGTFPMTVDLSDASGVSGVGTFGLPGDADIAGFGMGAMLMSWEIEEVPEPSAVVLVGLAGLALIGFRRK